MGYQRGNVSMNGLKVGHSDLLSADHVTARKGELVCEARQFTWMTCHDSSPKPII